MSDLLNNVYRLYYLKNKKSKLSDDKRARKILSRMYEAVSYMNFLEKDKQIKYFRSKIVKQIGNEAILLESKKIFDEFVLFYRKKVKQRNILTK